MSAFSVFDRLVRYSNYMETHQWEHLERLRPAVALRPSEMKNLVDDPRMKLAGISAIQPIRFMGLHVYEAAE